MDPLTLLKGGALLVLLLCGAGCSREMPPTPAASAAGAVVAASPQVLLAAAVTGGVEWQLVTPGQATPRALRSAAAYVNEASATSASTGMRIEGVMNFWPGAVLFRFLKRSDVRDADCIGSPWWFQGSVIRKVLSAARDGAGGANSPAMHATKKAALSQSWADSGANYLLCVKVTAPISVLWGPPRSIGKAAGSRRVSGLLDGANVDEVEVVPDPQCVQFYIYSGDVGTEGGESRRQGFIADQVQAQCGARTG